MKKPIKRGIFLLKNMLRGGGLLLSLSIIALIGLGFSSRKIVSDLYTYSSVKVNANVADIVTNSGTSLKLNTNKGDSNNGIETLKYSSTSLVTGLVYEDTIGNQGNIKYYFYLDISNFKKSLNYSSIFLDLTLSYSSSVSDTSSFTILNSDTTSNLKYAEGNKPNYSDNSYDFSSSSLSTSYSSNTIKSSSSNMSLGDRQYLLFELEYVFTVSDVSKVIDNECSVTDNLFNLNIKINSGN